MTEKGRAMGGQIIVGYDHTECAQAALGTAIELAEQSGDRVVIAFAYAPPGMMGEEVDEHRRALRELGDQATAGGLARAREAGVEAEVALVPERPVDGLLSLAAEREARMIVVGTYGESPLRGAILGSVPHKLLQLSTRPVLVVPA
jgi:nucleotide-binding universal stress UspA family protein